MTDNIHRAVWEWLLACPYIRDMYFNYARVNAGDTVLVPMTAGKHAVMQTYASGATEERYDFSLTHYAMVYDDPNSIANMETLLDIEQLTAWVEAQDGEANFPVLGETYTVTAVGVHESNAGYFAVQDNDSAKYTFQFYIDYLKG